MKMDKLRDKKTIYDGGRQLVAGRRLGLAVARPVNGLPDPCHGVGAAPVNGALSSRVTSRVRPAACGRSVDWGALCSAKQVVDSLTSALTLERREVERGRVLR
jgi:hypothetical protein